MSVQPGDGPDRFQMRRPSQDLITSEQESAARDTVLRGIDRGLYDAAGARDILEHLGLLEPLRVPPKRRTR